MYVEFMVGVLMTKLKDVFSLQITGEWGVEYTENETNTKVLRTTNFTPDGIINYSDVVLRCIHKDKVEKKKLRYEDIILEKSGGTEKTPVGRVVFCDESIEKDTYLCNNFTQAMRVNREIAVPKYVFYFMWNLHNSGKTELLQNKTTGIRNLQVKSYLNEKIPLPPLDEQRKIAAVLDKVSDLIAKRRQQLTMLDKLVKASFVEMFGDPVQNTRGWVKKCLDDLCDGIGDGLHGTPEYDENGDYAFINGNNLTDGRIKITDTTKFINKKEYTRLFINISNNAVLISINGTLGKLAFYNGEKVALGKSVCYCNLKDDVNKHFVYGLMKSESFSNFMESSSTKSTIKNVGLKAIREYGVILPPKEVQDNFAVFFSRIEKTKTTISCSLDRLEMLKRALMQEYFE